MSEPPTIRVRDATAKDVNILVEFNRRMALETETKELVPHIILAGVTGGLQRPDRCRYFVAERGGQVVGQAMITFEWSDWRNGELWWIQSVYVAPDHRRQGVFRSLYLHIESLARTAPCVRGLRLYVEQDNAIGQEVYASLGMVRAGYQVYEREF